MENTDLRITVGTHIPPGWKYQKIKEILKVKHGRNQREVEVKNGKYPILGSGGKIGESDQFLWNKPSVLIGRKGTINKPQYYNSPFWTVDTLFYTDIRNDYDTKWVYYLFQKINWLRYNEASGVPSLSASNIEAIKVLIPPQKEQVKIAEILSTWDRAIELKEDLLNCYLKQKKYYQQVVYGEKQHINSDHYKKVKLKNLLNESKEKNKDNVVNNVLSVTNSKGFVNQSDQFARSIASKNTERYKIVRKNQFAYNPSRVNVGSIDMLNNFDTGLLSPMYVIFDVKDGLNPKYLYHYLKSSRFIRRIPSYVQGSVRDSLTFKSLQAMPIMLPKEETQKKISFFFDSLDILIEISKREIENFKLQKKGLMQRLLTGQVRMQV